MQTLCVFLTLQALKEQEQEEKEIEKKEEKTVSLNLLFKSAQIDRKD